MSRNLDPKSGNSREEARPHGASLRGAIGKVAAASAFALALGEVVSLTQTVALARLVSLNFASWNQFGKWLRRVEALRDAA